MKLSELPNPLPTFRGTRSSFQSTFATPLKNLPPFVSEIVSAIPSIQKSQLTIAKIAFPPKHLDALAKAHGLSLNLVEGSSVDANGEEEARDLLQAALADWIDFLWVPTPAKFWVYADHDEYTTFFAARKANLNKVIQPLKKQGFEEIRDFDRRI